jgi:hypothetical protein
MNTTLSTPTAADSTLGRLRFFLQALLVFEMLGVGAELLLLAHWEGVWQWTPLILLGLGLVVMAAHAIFRNRASLQVFQLVMVLFVLSGILGTWLHYDGRVEFRLEMNPSLAGWELFRSAIGGSSTPPVLAPGVMIQMGLLGLAAVYRQNMYSSRSA